MLDLSSDLVQSILWSTALWLSVPMLLGLTSNRHAAFRNDRARTERAINLGFWFWEAMALGPLLWLATQSIFALIDPSAGINPDTGIDPGTGIDPSAGIDKALSEGHAQASYPTMSFVLAFALALWLGDGIAAARHRLEHSRLLWRWHAWHHSTDASDWLQTHRHHPISRLIAFAGEVVLLALWLRGLFGDVPWAAMLGAMACRRAYAIWLHSGSNWGVDRWFAAHLVLPAHHRAHHAGAPIYGGMFRHWDRLWSDQSLR